MKSIIGIPTKDIMPGDLPPPLREIHQQAHENLSEENSFDVLHSRWAEYLFQARESVPGIQIESQGETVYVGMLSPGCQACKQGAWDCVFVTMRCNLSCSFCYSPHAIPETYRGSGFGSTFEQIAANHEKTHITGVALSGGEPLLQPDDLFAWLSRFKARFPEKYYWLYTNGLLATESRLRRLGALGLNEIRFNMAATGYEQPEVSRNLATAVKHIPIVTIEIPAIPAHADKLLSCLRDWSKLGVKFLNLHELIYEPGTNAATMPGTRQTVITKDGHHTEIDPESRSLTLKVMQTVEAAGLPLSVNDCSLQSKFRQLRGRRRCLASITKNGYEKMIEGARYVSYCAYRDSHEYHFFHPNALDQARQLYPNCRFVRLVRTAPLALDDPGRWIGFEELDGH